jgi:UDP-N-acetylmuramate: L-alanyl-gamma-D-glutamyl-meso-diaminopimelate ligase
MTFTVLREGAPWGTFTSALVGEHNLYNQVAAVAALAREGATPEALASGFESFRGIRRRQQLLGRPGGVAVIDDFAHHPTAVRVTLEALRLRFGGRRLWAIFEPRSSSSRRRVFEAAYTAAFDAADQVVLAPPYDQSRIPEDERLSTDRLAAALRARGLEAMALPAVDEIVAAVAANVAEGDVVAVMSNGGFDGLHGKLLAALGERFGGD